MLIIIIIELNLPRYEIKLWELILRYINSKKFKSGLNLKAFKWGNLIKSQPQPQPHQNFRLNNWMIISKI